MRLLPSTIIFPHCSPQVLDASNIDYYADDRFNTMIKTIKPFAPPVFTGNHRKLCKDSSRLKQKFHYCLPISGTKDSDFCSKADRLDLLLPQTRSTRCHASVLHMLLVDVYEELQAHEYSPILTYGSLLGAVRNGSIIPFTEDTDIAYSGEITSDSALAEALWKKGYHLFTNRIWRVCVAPTHPLAGNLFDPDRPAKNFAMPYVDLYSMNKTEDEAAYTMQELRRRTLPTDSVEPFSKVMINGLPFNTVHDPEFFLLAEYGADFRSPKPRNRGK
ncbi:unnamed protein product [Phytophthora lilii]|uniref:Unnamed protein product n=1 Tax=Phytophthora lilii TaxID=2077276 RepID=A0A9W6WYX5_9STRA|nr:unnamed protein product [Phytophthora lilii]